MINANCISTPSKSVRYLLMETWEDILEVRFVSLGVSDFDSFNAVLSLEMQKIDDVGVKYHWYCFVIHNQLALSQRNLLCWFELEKSFVRWFFFK